MSDSDYGLTLLDGVVESDTEQEEKKRSHDLDGDDDGGSGRLVQFDLPGEEDGEYQLRNDFSLSDIRDGVVSFRTNQHCIPDFFSFS